MNPLLSLLYPHAHCMVCASSLCVFHGLCTACKEQMDRFLLPTSYAIPTSIPNPFYTQAYSAYNYKGCVRGLVHQLKYRGEPLLASAHLTPAMIALARSIGLPHGVVVPIPLSKERMLSRGYNQATYLASPIAKALALPIQEGLLWRTRATKEQVNLPLDQRIGNMHQAFTASTKAKGKTILLIDDVFTSGSTASASAHALLEQGARAVHILTAAHGVNDSDR